MWWMRLIAAATAPDVNRVVINVGSGQETSLRELIQVLGEVTDRQPEVLYNPQQTGGLPRLVADLERARRRLGYQPQVSLREGLQRMLVEDPRFARLQNPRVPAADPNNALRPACPGAPN